MDLWEFAGCQSPLGELAESVAAGYIGLLRFPPPVLPPIPADLEPSAGERHAASVLREALLAGPRSTCCERLARSYRFVRIVRWSFHFFTRSRARTSTLATCKPPGIEPPRRVPIGSFDVSLSVVWTRSGSSRGAVRCAAKRSAADQSIGSIAERRERIRYPEFRRRGWQIGSGPTEAQCGTSTQRIKGRGRRWDRRNAEAIMALDCLQSSHAWNLYWTTLEPARN